MSQHPLSLPGMAKAIRLYRQVGFLARSWLILMLSFCLLPAAGKTQSASTVPCKPRAVVIFIADDLGYNDTSTYGCSKVPCPNLDKLAAEGLKFTDAHSTTSVCTPSRFSLLTGRYAWRQQGTGILQGDAKLILPTRDECMTLGTMMQQAGYRTAAIGKWHLGLGRGSEPINWNKPISPGPREVGFDHSFILAATADRVPCVYIRNGEVANLDPNDPIEVNYTPGFRFTEEKTATTHPGLLKPWGRPRDAQHSCTIISGISRIGHMRGGTSALWNDQDMADDITREAVDFIRESAGTPIFLYFATNDIHVPRDPHQRFIGKSTLGIRGDVTVQMDDCLGRVRAALISAGYGDDCLFIFTSDNGPVINDGYLDNSETDCAGHNPAAPFSGGKYTLKEGGTRVPFIVSWPGRVRQGESAALISQVDLPRSLATLVGVEIPPGAMTDSQNQLPALLGQDAHGRSELVEQAFGSRIALRSGSWKYIPGSRPLLYNLATDTAEQNDVAAEHPNIVQRLHKRLQEIRSCN